MSRLRTARCGPSRDDYSLISGIEWSSRALLCRQSKCPILRVSLGHANIRSMVGRFLGSTRGLVQPRCSDIQCALIIGPWAHFLASSL